MSHYRLAMLRHAEVRRVKRTSPNLLRFIASVPPEWYGVALLTFLFSYIVFGWLSGS